MKIIAIEGLDKSGKHTQADKLVKHLRWNGYKVEKSEFHRYDTPTGKLIQDWLYGRYNVDQLTIELIMAADKQAQQKWFEELEEEGIDYLILDRYTGSQSVYATANNVDTLWTYSLQYNMRKPDLEIFIDIPPEVSMERKGKHGDNDRYESNLELLKKVRQLFINRDNIYIDGLQTINDISADIIKQVDSYA